MQDIIPFPWNFWLGAGSVLAGFFLSTIWLAFANLSPGAIHKLEETDPEIASRLEVWLRRREEMRVYLRILDFCIVIFALLCLLSWVLTMEPGSLAVWLPVLLGLGLFYILGPEIAVFELPRPRAWRLLAAALPAVNKLCWLVLPLAWPLVRWRRRVRGGREKSGETADRATMEDEIRSLLEQDESSAARDRELESDERRMIRGVFDLDNTLVREIMTPRIDVRALPDTATLDQLKKLVRESGHSRIPIYHQSIDQIVGLAYAKDLIQEELDHELPLSDQNKLLHPPIFIPETKNVGDLLAELQQQHSHFSIVIDEYGGTEGVVTLEDIIEEIVGEIHDEYDETEVADDLPQPNSDGVVEIDGRTSIYVLNQQLELDLPEDQDYDTIGGFISAQLGRIPRPGEEVALSTATITVKAADRRRVLRAAILPGKGKGKDQQSIPDPHLKTGSEL